MNCTLNKKIIRIIIANMILINLQSCSTEKNMNTKYLTINGNETLENIDSEEVLVLSKFYKAFNGKDMNLMADVWLNNNEASMNNPLGGIMRGWKEISAVYNRIFNGKASVYVEFYDFTIHKTDSMFFATGKEKGYFKSDKIEIPLAIRTSRVFIKSENKWKQIQHHGSIDNPELLKKYQEMVKNNLSKRQINIFSIVKIIG